MAKRNQEDDGAKPQPEVVAENVVRETPKENPILDNPVEMKSRFPGAWKKVTREELIALQDSGRLKGYDPATSEALEK